MLLPILKYGAPELKAVCGPVDVFNAELEKIARNMVETMYAAPGIGLAAAQVGLAISLTTVDLSAGEEAGRLMVICNPAIVSAEGEQKHEEGCLSIPDFADTVVRPRKLVVRGQDIHGDEVQIVAEDLLARCLAHEIDHLNGVLFIDHLSALKRNLIKSKIKRLARSGEW
jgi:peptide deformylase